MLGQPILEGAATRADPLVGQQALEIEYARRRNWRVRGYR
jgi:hypothetical protein